MTTPDIVFRGATLVDGSGDPRRRADVRVRGNVVVEVAGPRSLLGGRVIDCDGLVLAPGLIDAHVHADAHLLADPAFESGVRQGVTTVIVGQDGCGYAPASRATQDFMRAAAAGFNGNPSIDWNWNTIAEYLDRVDRSVGVNVGALIPFGCLRADTVGLEDRPASAGSVRAMRRIVRQARTDGALGISWGYHYAPNTYATVDELSEVATAFPGGVFAAHMRDYEREQAASIADCVEVGRRSRMRVHIAHLNMHHHEGLPSIDAANAGGIPTTFDTYPYLAGATTLIRVLPAWCIEGSVSDILDRLGRPEVRARLRPWLEAPERRWEVKRISWVASAHDHPVIGLAPDEAARNAMLSITDFICDLLIGSSLEVGLIGFRHHRQSEDDVERLLAHPRQVVGSDGVFVGPNPHPRGFGTFAHILSTFVRERQVLTLEEAIRHMTSAPAEIFGLGRRGHVTVGAVADLIVFDPVAIQDRATYEHGSELAVGVRWVMVDGAFSIDDGQLTGTRNGRAIRGRIDGSGRPT